jgi:peptidyl-prolyl cis-trans isomerase B (cyclophilin B)
MNNKNIIAILVVALIVGVSIWLYSSNGNVNMSQADKELNLEAGNLISNSTNNINNSSSTSANTNNTNTNNINIKNMSKVTVSLMTNKGEVVLELNGDRTPNTVDNFVKLSEAGFYNGTRFHRVIKDFMIQGGDPLSKDVSNKQYWGMGGPDYKFADEVFADDDMNRGDIAMANSGPNTNGSQFFIVTAQSTPWLNGKHTIFGKVVKGMDVVDSIENTATDASDKPLEDVIVNSVKVIK